MMTPGPSKCSRRFKNQKDSVSSGPLRVQGIALAEAERPDLIILDLLMPGMNGFEVLDHLGKSPVPNGCPIILFTVKQLTAEEKRRIKGRITWLAQKEGFQRQGS